MKNPTAKAFTTLSKPSLPAGGEFAPVIPASPEAGTVAHADSPSAQETPPATSLLHVFVATFTIRDPQSGKLRAQVIEVPHTERPKADQAAAWAALKKLNPDLKSENVRRTGGRIISRPGGKLPEVKIRLGETIRQLFPDKSEFEAARTIGTVIFDGALCDVILRHVRSKSVFALTLRQPGGTVINFSEQFSTTRLIDELPKILESTLGEFAPTLKTYLRS